MKKQCINSTTIIGVIFVIGILLGNIAIHNTQNDIIPIENTTKKTECIMYLEKPEPIKHFLYQGIISTTNGRFLDEVTSRVEEDIDIPAIESVTKTEAIVEMVPTTTEIITTQINIHEEKTTEEPTTNIDVTPEGENKNTNIECNISADRYDCSQDEIYFTCPQRAYTEEQKELIVKMLYCEAGSTSWDCQVATCSAIINLIEHYGGDFSILDNANKFDPAPYYRYKTPTREQYNVLNFVLSGHLIANIKYFRTEHYHYDFGTPMFAIDNVYFSK